VHHSLEAQVVGHQLLLCSHSSQPLRAFLIIVHGKLLVPIGLDSTVIFYRIGTTVLSTDELPQWILNDLSLIRVVLGCRWHFLQPLSIPPFMISQSFFLILLSKLQDMQIESGSSYVIPVGLVLDVLSNESVTDL
jgi:hypothetical protein